MKSPQGLTVIELLLVLAIAVILIALMFPSVSGPSDTPNKSMAKNDVTQIANAVLYYEADYGKLPSAGNGIVGSQLIAVLTGNDTTANPKKVVYLEVPDATNKKSGLRHGTFIDPWGGPYQIAIATNNILPITAGTNHTSVHKRVAVWNDPGLGTNTSWFTDAKKQRRYVTSWD